MDQPESNPIMLCELDRLGFKRVAVTPITPFSEDVIQVYEYEFEENLGKIIRYDTYYGKIVAVYDEGVIENIGTTLDELIEYMVR